MVDEQLQAPVEELRQRLRPVRGLEAVVLLDRDPGTRGASAQLVVPAGELLLLREQLVAGGLPLLMGSDPVLGSFSCLSCLPFDSILSPVRSVCLDTTGAPSASASSTTAVGGPGRPAAADAPAFARCLQERQISRLSGCQCSSKLDSRVRRPGAGSSPLPRCGSEPEPLAAAWTSRLRSRGARSESRQPERCDCPGTNAPLQGRRATNGRPSFRSPPVDR